VLDNLCTLGRSYQQHRRLLHRAGPGDGIRSAIIFSTGQRQIELRQQSAGAFAVYADNDAVRMQKVGNRRAFAQKLWVRGDVKHGRRNTVAFNHAADPLIGVNRYGAFFYDDFVAIHGAGNFGGNRLDIRKVGVAGLTLRRTHGDEDQVGLARGLGQIGGELDILVAMLFQQLRQVLLVNDGVAGAERLHLRLIIINAQDLMADLRKADRCHQTDVSRTDYRNF
jgi:hypothetical protein